MDIHPHKPPLQAQFQSNTQKTHVVYWDSLVAKVSRTTHFQNSKSTFKYSKGKRSFGPRSLAPRSMLSRVESLYIELGLFIPLACLSLSDFVYVDLLSLSLSLLAGGH